jgi:hypothetical protein
VILVFATLKNSGGMGGTIWPSAQENPVSRRPDS